MNEEKKVIVEKIIAILKDGKYTMNEASRILRLVQKELWDTPIV